MKKIIILIAAFFMSIPVFSQGTKLESYFNQTFHGNMVGKVITADMTIVDENTINFTANLPAGKKNHIYSYKIVEDSGNKLVTEWYENDKLDKTVTFSSFEADGFVMEVKGKGKVQMKVIF